MIEYVKGPSILKSFKALWGVEEEMGEDIRGRKGRGRGEGEVRDYDVSGGGG